MKCILFVCIVLAFSGCSKPQETTGKADSPTDAPKASVVPAVATTAPPKAAPKAAAPAEQYGETEVAADCKRRGLRLADTITTNTARGTVKRQRWEMPGAGVWMVVTYQDGQVVATTTGHD